MSRKEENGNMETLVTSELCSNSLPRRLPGNGKGECWPGDMRKIPRAKTGNMAIPFQSEVGSGSLFVGKSGDTILISCRYIVFVVVFRHGKAGVMIARLNWP